MSPASLYQQALAEQGFVADPAQAEAVTALQACYESLQCPQAAKGVYLWGPVGRGKTWLMDQFYGCLKVPARRQHFHHFMAWVHQRLFQLNGTADPLHSLASGLAAQIRVLCFDELFVNDIGDAIILGRLFQALFDQGVVIVATSNQPPGQLYQDGFNRERFLPAIEAIERHMRVLSVAGEHDHRLHPGASHQRFWLAAPGQPSALHAVFAQLSPGDVGTEQPLQIGSRQIQVVRRSSQAIWCRFSDLCEQALSALEFMALCDQFPAILMSEIPALSGEQRAGRIARGTEDGAQRVAAGDRQLPALAPRDDSVRRFIALVDECYDRRVALYLEADVALEALYTHGYLAFPYQRTLSRLREMQLQRFA
ncbi:cell division protein ZapE [Pseudomonas hunanensis]|uniref:Cell division protein ZapE n=1 Tax=Pseudomonas hunanensis TaxID=1247546 RepID=A0ACC6K080_9PSED|nr:cell division protein ZapE [Pseudomonas hunanensis]MDR6711782.1 cell division protein ZapE [Pseudomonas hunanensis]